MALQSEVVQVAGIDVGAGCEVETVEEVLAVVFLPVEGPSYSTILFLVVV